MLIANFNYFKEANTDLEFDSPRALSNWMRSNIKYDHNDSSWTLRDHDTVMKEKKGDCHDQSLFEQEELKKMGYKPKKLFMIEYSGDEICNAGATHTLCYYEENGKLYWFENAWEDEAGIHGPYKNLKELKEAIHESWNYGGTCDRLYITTCSGVSVGMDLNEYADTCLKGNYIPKDYFLKESTVVTEVDVNGAPAGDEGGGDTPDFTGDPVSVTGNDGGDAAPQADDGGGDPPADDTTAGDETEDFTDDGGDENPDDTGDNPDEGGDTPDFTDDGGGDDMGGGEGGDAGADDEGDTGGDAGGGGTAPGDGSIKADDARGLENEIFADLTPTQIAVKHKELKNNFVAMHNAIDELVDRVNEINVSGYQSTISFISTKLADLKEMIADYLTDVYSTKSYMENAMNYNRFLATMNGIKEILEEISKGIKSENDDSSNSSQ